MCAFCMCVIECYTVLCPASKLNIRECGSNSLFRYDSFLDFKGFQGFGTHIKYAQNIKLIQELNCTPLVKKAKLVDHMRAHQSCS